MEQFQRQKSGQSLINFELDDTPPLFHQTSCQPITLFDHPLTIDETRNEFKGKKTEENVLVVLTPSGTKRYRQSVL